ncbi:hypothetical protein GE09DRAFT_1232696 [Coniochaeta sp. 2T2.1]|nr:hypothetical protein GE09DRAFT_1232696 [Coniochaeta sp. 2T2.1]
MQSDDKFQDACTASGSPTPSLGHMNSDKNKTGIGTYHADHSACAWCKRLSDSTTVSEVMQAEALSSSATILHPQLPLPFLHYLCISSLSNLNWNRLCDGIFESVSQLDTPGLTWEQLYFERHAKFGDYYMIDLAIKFDPTWSRLFDDFYTPDSDHSDNDRANYKKLEQTVAGDLWWLDTLWFVDYDIHRVTGTAIKAGGWECRTAPGTFVQVWRGDAGWDFKNSLSHVVYEFKEVLPYHLGRLGVEFDDSEGRNPDCCEDWNDGLEKMNGVPRLGVLAFEPRTRD